MNMDDGELELSDWISNPETNLSFEELFRNARTCNHTHTCKPPGLPAVSHTHTCYHNHTELFEISEEEKDEVEMAKKGRKPLGNKEAVRKYREKKKAHTAYLEEEVKKLRLSNQHLMRKLQRQPALEAEVIRLRRLLVELRGKVDAELGAFPYQKQCSTPGLQCEVDGHCFVGNPVMVGWEGGCVPAVVNCQFDPNGDSMLNGDIAEAVNSVDAIGRFVSSNSPAVR